MAGMRLYTSNHLEKLLDALAEAVREPLPSPLDREVIVVQSRGMERWVSLKLAGTFGIWANAKYPFPNSFVLETIRDGVPGLPDSAPFDPEVLAWRVMKLLPACLDEPGFAEPRNYLLGEGAPLKRLQLSRRIAGAFDQYTVYRPDRVLGWDEGQEDHWQARLWRLATKGYPPGHKAAVRKRFLDAVRTGAFDPKPLPARISIFGISLLPPFHMDVFAALSRHAEVRLFLMNPCREYWFDLVSEKEATKRQRRKGGRVHPAGDLHFEQGHPLLASLGKLGGRFFERLYEDVTPDVIERFEDPGVETLLSALRSDILYLRDRGGAEKTVAPDDVSLRVHSCHSPMREVEVLHDLLLDLFNRKSGEGGTPLRPEEILVMTPDIEKYAPFVSAVFDGVQDPSLRIPYSIADRSVRREGRAADLFVSVLDLYGSRFGVTRVLDLLESPRILRRFGLEGKEVETVRRWVGETRIRWGMDGEDRRKKGVPPFEENSWKAGLDRLLLGYALPGGGERIFSGILPCDDVEGSDAQTLGKFLDFRERLFDGVASLDAPRTLSEWGATLATLLTSLFDPGDDGEAEHLDVLRELASLSDLQRLSGYDGTVEFPIIRAYLADRLGRETAGRGFLASGVTFATMLPMRSIPFRVIVLVGMDDGAFPRIVRPPGFDLLAQDPRPGDPSKRDEDRYLFLEALLSAREHFVISYVGQSLKDNSAIPPSVLVSELLDVVRQGFRHADPEKGILEHVVVTHPLQAFSPRYFRPGGPLVSFSEENRKALVARREKVAGERPLLSSPLPAPTEELRAMGVDDLSRFFAHPPRYFVNARLRIYLGEADLLLDEDEPFRVEGLEKHEVEGALVEWGLRGVPLDDRYPLVRGRGVLPAGRMGEAAYADLLREAKRFVRKVSPCLAGRELPPREVDLSVDGVRITGTISGVRPDGLVRYRCADVKAKDFLRVWIDHLLLNASDWDGYPRESLVAGKDAVWRLLPVEEPREVLSRLLAIYREGVCRPIPFFPRTSCEYAVCAVDPGKAEKAMRAARKVWEGTRYGKEAKGEKDDGYNDLCFGRGPDPLDDDFRRLSLSIFEPILSHREEA